MSPDGSGKNLRNSSSKGLGAFRCYPNNADVMVSETKWSRIHLPVIARRRFSVESLRFYAGLVAGDISTSSSGCRTPLNMTLLLKQRRCHGERNKVKLNGISYSNMRNTRF